MTDQPLVECIPNFSEGHRADVIERILASVRAVSGVEILRSEMDADHNRAVVTFVGAPEAVAEAAVRAAATAAELINLDEHRGQHPRIGATDVTVTVHRIAMQPTTSATPAVQTPPDAGATSRSTIRSTARSDAGAPRRNAPTRSRSRTRATPISPTQPVDPRGDDPETPPPPLVPIGAF